MIAKEARETVGNLALLTDGSVKEMVLLACELIHNDSMGATALSILKPLFALLGDETHRRRLQHQRYGSTRIAYTQFGYE